MNKTYRDKKLGCFNKCHESLKDCMNRGEDESVCRMEQVPCICRCNSTSQQGY